MKKFLILTILLLTPFRAHACGCHATPAAELGGGVGAAAFFLPLQAAILTAPEWINEPVWDWIGVDYWKEYPNAR